MNITDFSKCFIDCIDGVIEVFSDKAKEKMPDYLIKPGFAISYSDPTGKHFLQLYSKINTFKLYGNLVKRKDTAKYALITIDGKNKIEEVLFSILPHVTVKPFAIINGNMHMRSLTFSTIDYKNIYLNMPIIKFQNEMNVPFYIKHNGLFVGTNILYVSEYNKKLLEQYFEYIVIFGNKSLIPKNEEEIKDFIYSSCISGLFDQDINFDSSFTDVLKNIKGAVEENVLLLGSFKSESNKTYFKELKKTFAEYGYNAFLLSDSPDVAIQTNIEKMITACIASGFVVILDNEASGHIAEMTKLLDLRLRPTIILRFKDDPATAFLEDSIRTDEMFNISKISKISKSEVEPLIKWAKDKMQKRKQSFNSINSWRNEESS